MMKINIDWFLLGILITVAQQWTIIISIKGNTYEGKLPQLSIIIMGLEITYSHVIRIPSELINKGSSSP